MSRRLSWKSYFYFSHIRIYHITKSRMLLINHESFYNFWNFHRKNYILAKKQHGKTFTIFFHPNCCTQNSNWICLLDILAKPNAFITHSLVILTRTEISYTYILYILSLWWKILIIWMNKKLWKFFYCKLWVFFESKWDFSMWGNIWYVFSWRHNKTTSHIFFFILLLTLYS